MTTQTSDIAKRSLNGVAGAADALTSSIGNDTATTVRSKGLSLTVAKKAANESNEASTLDGDPSGSSIAMPAFGDILSSTDGLGQIATKLVVSNNNPFQSTSSKSGVQGSIVTLTLSNDNGEELAVNGTKKPFIISIPNASPVGVVTSSVKLLEYRYHKVSRLIQTKNKTKNYLFDEVYSIQDAFVVTRQCYERNNNTSGQGRLLSCLHFPYAK
jgi:hypothetical protein